jgi:hypothetical protein
MPRPLNVFISAMLAIMLGGILYSTGASLMVSLIWPLILGFQCATWFFAGKQVVPQKELERWR